MTRCVQGQPLQEQQPPGHRGVLLLIQDLLALHHGHRGQHLRHRLQAQNQGRERRVVAIQADGLLMPKTRSNRQIKPHRAKRQAHLYREQHQVLLIGAR